MEKVITLTRSTRADAELDFLFDQALKMKRDGNHRHEEQLLRHILFLNPNLPGALVNLGLIHQANGNFQDAINLFYRALELQPDYKLARFNLACALGVIAKHEEAIFQYRICAEQDPGHADSYYNLGHEYQSIGDRKSAALFYRVFLSLEAEGKWADKARKALKEIGGLA